MTNTEIAAYRYARFKRAKRDIYNETVFLFQLGYPIKNIISRVYGKFRKVDSAFTKAVITEYVWKSVNHFLANEKQQGN